MPAIIKNPSFYNNGSSNRSFGTSGMAGIPGTPGVSGFVSITEGLPVSYEEIPRATKLESRFIDLYDNYDFSPYSTELRNQVGIIDFVNKVAPEVNDSDPIGGKKNIGKVRNEVTSIKNQISSKPKNTRESRIKKESIQALKNTIQDAFLPARVFSLIYKKIRK